MFGDSSSPDKLLTFEQGFKTSLRTSITKLIEEDRVTTTERLEFFIQNVLEWYLNIAIIDAQKRSISDVNTRIAALETLKDQEKITVKEARELVERKMELEQLKEELTTYRNHSGTLQQDLEKTIKENADGDVKLENYLWELTGRISREAKNLY